MKNHKLIQKWTNGQTSLNAWLSIPEAFSAEIMAHTGFDSITIDMQHGVNDYLKTVDMLRAINTTDTVTMVRVPWLDPAHIMKILDAGVNGIICPMINNKKEAQKLVEYSYYPPFGKRSFGPIRAKYVYEGNYAKVANESLLIIAMIETKEALDNLDEILSVDGIDAVYIGPADLSFNLGSAYNTVSAPLVMLAVIGSPKIEAPPLISFKQVPILFFNIFMLSIDLLNNSILELSTLSVKM